MESLLALGVSLAACPAPGAGGDGGASAQTVLLLWALGAVPLVVGGGRTLLRGAKGPSSVGAAGVGRSVPGVATKLIDVPPRRRRVIVGSEARARLLGDALFPGPEQRAGLSLLDGVGLDGFLVDRLRGEAPDEVYFDLGAEMDERAMAKAGARMLMDGVSVHFVLPEHGGPAVRATVVRRGTQSVISLHPVRESASSRVIRRLLDLLGAGVLLVVFLPLLALVSALVWSSLGWPVLYAQKRVGRSGRLFRLYKFRSMIDGADELLRRSPEVYHRYVTSNFKLPVEDDPRITRLGRFLRRTSLDELPQLWNVLRGDMSLVGPRAIVPEELANYADYAPMLLRVKPGLTGLWQVSGRSTIPYPERARIDLHYVQGRSLLTDLEILLRTVPAVIRQRGAL